MVANDCWLPMVQSDCYKTFLKTIRAVKVHHEFSNPNSGFSIVQIEARTTPTVVMGGLAYGARAPDPGTYNYFLQFSGISLGRVPNPRRPLSPLPWRSSFASPPLLLRPPSPSPFALACHFFPNSPTASLAIQPFVVCVLWLPPPPPPLPPHRNVMQFEALSHSLRPGDASDDGLGMRGDFCKYWGTDLIKSLSDRGERGPLSSGLLGVSLRAARTMRRAH
jgi:hypothetical protein